MVNRVKGFAVGMKPAPFFYIFLFYWEIIGISVASLGVFFFF